MILLLTMLWMLFIHIHWNYTDNHIHFISMPLMGCSRLVIGDGSHGTNPQCWSVRPRMPDIRWALSMRFVLYSIFVQLYLQKYTIFVLFLDKISKLSSMSIWVWPMILSSLCVRCHHLSFSIIGKLLHFNILPWNMITALKSQNW